MSPVSHLRLAPNRGTSRSASSSPVSASTYPRWRPSFCASHLGGAEIGTGQGLRTPSLRGINSNHVLFVNYTLEG
jgi:hypothetical protein